MVYQDVTRNRNISAAAKGLYAYLSSFCGASDECYPSIDTIVKEMGIGKDTFYRHINALVEAGVVKKQQVISSDGKFGRTVYRLTHEVLISDFPNTQNKETDFPNTQNEESDFEESDFKETNNNNINNNNIKNNSNIYISSEPDKPTLNPSGILLPLNDKSLYDVPQENIDTWVTAYPAVDVIQELHKMRAWLESNPTRRKTKRGINRFINSWLSKEQDRGGTRQQYSDRGTDTRQQGAKNSFNNFQQNDYDMDELEKNLLSN